MEPVTKPAFERDSSDSDQSAREGVTQSVSESNYSEANPNAGENLGQETQASEMASAFSADLPSNPFEDDSEILPCQLDLVNLSESNYSETNPNAGENLGQEAQASEMASAFSADLPSNPFEDDSEILPFQLDLVNLDSDTDSEDEELVSRRIVRLGSPMEDQGEFQEDNWPPSVEPVHSGPATSRPPRVQRRIHPASSAAVKPAKKQTAGPVIRSEAEMYLASFHDPEAAQRMRNHMATVAPRPITSSAADSYLLAFHDPESEFYKRCAGTGPLDPASYLRRFEARCASDRLYLPDSTIGDRCSKTCVPSGGSEVYIEATPFLVCQRRLPRPTE